MALPRCASPVLLLAFLTACVPDTAPPDVAAADAPTTDAGVDAADAPSAPDVPTLDAPDAGEVASDAPVPDFLGIYETILAPRCVRCHGAGSSVPMPDAETAYGSLVDVPVLTRWIHVCVEGWEPRITPYRVRPGDTRSSMLAWLADCYVRDAEHGVLTAEEAATIRAWIAAGAPESALTRR